MEEAEPTRSSERYIAREKGLLAAVANLCKAGISTFSHQKVSARADLQARTSLREESQTREREIWKLKILCLEMTFWTSIYLTIGRLRAA